MALDSTIVEVRSDLGMILYHRQLDREAVNAIEEAASLEPALQAPHLLEGKAYLETRDAANARPPLKAALPFFPGAPIEARSGALHRSITGSIVTNGQFRGRKR